MQRSATPMNAALLVLLAVVFNAPFKWCRYPVKS
jgi:hypothetical protein